MNRLKVIAVTAAAAAAFELSGCSSEAPENLPYDVAAPVSAADQAAVQDGFDTMKRYWVGKNVGVEAVELEILLDGEKEWCPGVANSVQKATNPQDIEYCESTDTVIVSQAGINLVNFMQEQEGLRDRKNAKRWWKIAMAHEIGHGIQDAHGVEWPRNRDPLDAGQKLELQADCLAGAAVRKAAPMAWEVKTPMFRQLAPKIDEQTHGNFADRERNFIIGGFEGADACGVPGMS